MKCRIVVLSILVILSFVVSNFAQAKPPAADAENEKKIEDQKERILKMLDESAAAANSLRLPENRALLNAMTADLYWRFDEKRAREMFKNTASDIGAFYADLERQKPDSTGAVTFSFITPNDPRVLVLPLVARHDASLAFELLLQTRPQKLADAIAKYLQPNNKGPAGVLSFDMDQYRVRQEITLEQQYAMLAADEDPDKAASLIKDAMAKGVNANIIPLLQKLFKKDEKRAAEIGADVIRKLIDSDMGKNQNDMSTALAFLQNAVKKDPRPEPSPAAGTSDTSAPAEKQFSFTDAQIRELANKLANTLLQPSNSILTAAIMSQAMPVLEKIVPERATALKQRQAESQRSMPSEMQGIPELQKAFDPSSTAEDILAQLSKMPDGPLKTQLYPALQNKIGQLTDDAKAKKLIDQIPDEKERSIAQERYDSAKIARATADGKLDDARKMIGAMTDRSDRIRKLVDLGIQFFKKGGDSNIEAANAIMTEARTLAGDYPADGEELNDMMEVVRGYTTIEPETAFRMFEPVIDQLNEYVQASSVVERYEKRGQAFRNGELILSVNSAMRGGNIAFRYMQHLQAFGKADLDLMAQLVERFARADYRALVRIYVLRGLLTDDKKPGVFKPQGGPGSIVVVG
jgi:hypothetical protein